MESGKYERTFAQGQQGSPDSATLSPGYTTPILFESDSYLHRPTERRRELLDIVIHHIEILLSSRSGLDLVSHG